MAVSRIGIIGLGLIGGSIGRTLLARGHEVVGFDTDSASCLAATSSGFRAVDSIADLCAREPQIVFVAVPLRAMAATFTELRDHVRPGTLLTDVGSVKQPVIDVVASAGLESRFVGAHPMAGTEQAGFAASSAELLLAAPWALTITASTPRDGFLDLLQLICRDLRGRVIPLAPDVHDASVAMTSHLPHVAANGLLNVVAQSPYSTTAFALAAGSFRDGTRVGGTNPRRTEAMIVDNLRWVAPGVRALAADMLALADALEAGADVSAFFDRALDAKQRAQVPHASHRPLDLAALTDVDWRDSVLAIGSGGGQIIAVSDALVATIAQ